MLTCFHLHTKNTDVLLLRNNTYNESGPSTVKWAIIYTPRLTSVQHSTCAFFRKLANRKNIIIEYSQTNSDKRFSISSTLQKVHSLKFAQSNFHSSIGLFIANSDHLAVKALKSSTSISSHQCNRHQETIDSVKSLFLPLKVLSHLCIQLLLRHEKNELRSSFPIF